MTGKTVLLANALSGPGLAAAKALHRAGFRVMTAGFERLPMGLRSRYSAGESLLAGTSWPELEQSLVALVERVHPDVLLPLGTPSALVASRRSGELAALTALNVPAFEAFRAAFDKTACMAECRRLGIPCPAVYSPDEATELLERGRDGTLVVKPGFDEGAATGVQYVRSRQELQAALEACRLRFGKALIEEYIPGGPEAMTTATVLYSPQSRLAAAFAVRKTRQWPQTGGLMAAGKSIAAGALIERVLPFFASCGWRGPAEIELKFDWRDGQDKVIEINPRFPAYLRFAGECGIDLPVLAARLSLDGEVASPPGYAAGVAYVNPGLRLRVLMADLRAGALRQAVGGLLAERNGAFRSIGHWLDDPLPFVARGLASVFGAGRGPSALPLARY